MLPESSNLREPSCFDVCQNVVLSDLPLVASHLFLWERILGRHSDGKLELILYNKTTHHALLLPHDLNVSTQPKADLHSDKVVLLVEFDEDGLLLVAIMQLSNQF